MSNIIVLFVEINGGIKSAAACINMVTGSKYTTSRVMEWIRGYRQPSPVVLNLMLSVVVPYAVKYNRIPDLRLATC